MAVLKWHFLGLICFGMTPMLIFFKLNISTEYEWKIFPRFMFITNCLNKKEDLLNNRTLSLNLVRANLSIVWDPGLQIYRNSDGRPIIWTYWNTVKMPGMIRLSLGTVACFNKEHYHLQVVHDSDVPKLLSNIHEAFKHFEKPAHKADYLRARILDKYGGMYIDADSIALNSFTSLFEKLPRYNLVLNSWPENSAAVGSLGMIGPMTANSSLTNQWVTKLHQKLNAKLKAIKQKKKNALKWTEILKDLLQPIVTNLRNDAQFRYFSIEGHSTYSQLIWPKKQALSDVNSKMEIGETEFLIWYNNGMLKAGKTMNEAEIFQSNTMVPSILRYAYNRCRNDTRTDKEKVAGKIIIHPRTYTEKDLFKWIQNLLFEIGLL